VRAQERATLDPMARTAEVSTRYGGRWVIYRDLCPDGTHDEWVAEPRQPADGVRRRITADDIDSLAEQLAEAER
jgi:hypothetical protein